MGRRHPDLRFMPGYFVFPDGKLDQSDYDDLDLVVETFHLHNFAPIKGVFNTLTSRLAAIHIMAAMRECHEETGFALAIEDTIPFFENLHCIAQAITPKSSPIRFDTRFFLGEGDRFQPKAAPSGELVDVDWYPVANILRSPHLADVTEFVLKEALRHWSGNHVADAVVPALTYDEGDVIITRDEVI